MAEDVTDDLCWRAGLDLTGRVRVTKHVGTNEIGVHARSLRVHHEPMPDGRRTGQPAVRHPVADEDGAVASVRWALVAEIASECTRHRVQERQMGDRPRLGRRTRIVRPIQSMSSRSSAVTSPAPMPYVAIIKKIAKSRGPRPVEHRSRRGSVARRPTAALAVADRLGAHAARPPAR